MDPDQLASVFNSLCLVSYYIVFLKKFIHVYCLSKVRDSLRSLCIICPLKLSMDKYIIWQV